MFVSEPIVQEDDFMDKRGNVFVALVLIGFGILFLLINFFPGLKGYIIWPYIFFILAAGFFIPPLVIPSARKGLAALFIPGMILMMLGLIFTYNMFSHDWRSWGYMWLLIPSSVGMGLASASWLGGWGRDATVVGFWLMVISLVFFAIVGALVGTSILRFMGPVILIILGLFFVARSLRRSS
jgi:hypothetical protein